MRHYLACLISHLPEGEAQYTREPDGTWGVAIFSPGSVHVLAKVATGMDKSVAAWMALRLNDRAD